MSKSNTPPNPLTRMISLIKTGPRALYLRFYDQIRRRITGAPDFSLTRIRPFLHVGGQHYKRGWHHMEAEGITGILNMREDWHDDVKMGVGGKRHLQLAVRDNTPVSIEYLHQAADFIKEHKDNNEQVYVHCGVGVGRAPSAAAAYFIKYENMTPNEALATMRQIRPFIHPTGKQRYALEQFEADVRRESV